jgi:hypothetical protein
LVSVFLFNHPAEKSCAHLRPWSRRNIRAGG